MMGLIGPQGEVFSRNPRMIFKSSTCYAKSSPGSGPRGYDAGDSEFEKVAELRVWMLVLKKQELQVRNSCQEGSQCCRL